MALLTVYWQLKRIDFSDSLATFANSTWKKSINSFARKLSLLHYGAESWWKNISNNLLFKKIFQTMPYLKTLSWIVSPFSVIFWRRLKETSRPSGPNLKLIISWELASTIYLQCLYNIFTMSLQYLYNILTISFSGELISTISLFFIHSGKWWIHLF